MLRKYDLRAGMAAVNMMETGSVGRLHKGLPPMVSTKKAYGVEARRGGRPRAWGGLAARCRRPPPRTREEARRGRGSDTRQGAGMWAEFGPAIHHLLAGGGGNGAGLGRSSIVGPSSAASGGLDDDGCLRGPQGSGSTLLCLPRVQGGLPRHGFARCSTRFAGQMTSGRAMSAP